MHPIRKDINNIIGLTLPVVDMKDVKPYHHRMNEEIDARFSKYADVELDNIDLDEFMLESVIASLMDSGYDRGRAVIHAQELLNSEGLPGLPVPG